MFKISFKNWFLVTYRVGFGHLSCRVWSLIVSEGKLECFSPNAFEAAAKPNYINYINYASSELSFLEAQTNLTLHILSIFELRISKNLIGVSYNIYPRRRSALPPFSASQNTSKDMWLFIFKENARKLKGIYADLPGGRSAFYYQNRRI